MRNKVIPLFIFFGLGKLNAASITAQDPAQPVSSAFQGISENITEELRSSSQSYIIPTGNSINNIDGIPVFSGPILSDQSGLESAKFVSQIETNNAAESDIGSVVGSSYPGESISSLLPPIDNKTFRKMMIPKIESDGEKFSSLKKYNTKFFNEENAVRLAMSTFNETADNSILEVYKSNNIFPTSNGTFSVPLTMIMDDDWISGGFVFYDLESNKIKSKLKYFFLETEIPGIEVLIKCAMHLISLYRFELSPCEVYTKFSQEEPDKYYQSFIVVRNDKAYLLTHSGAEELTQNPILEEKILVPSGNEIFPKNIQPIYLFSINSCGDFYKGRSDKSILQIEEQTELSDQNLIAKGIEILSLLLYACNNKKLTPNGREIGRASILKNLPIVGPLSFFTEDDDLKKNLMYSLEDFWVRKIKNPIKTIRDFSKFLTNLDKFQITKPNFENIAQEAINRFQILFPEIIKPEEFSKFSSSIKLNTFTEPIPMQSNIARKLSGLIGVGQSPIKNGGK